MATANVSKTFKLDPETVESLQQIMQKSGLSWDGVFAMLANLYTAQEAAKSVGRETELQDFVAILNKAQEAYTSALAINANTDERIRAEYERRLRTAEEATASLKDKALAAEEKAKAMEQERNDVQEKLKAATKEAEQATNRAEKAEKAVEDKTAFIGMLHEKLSRLEEQVKELSALAEAGKDADEQRRRADTAEAKAKDLQEQLAKAEEQHKAQMLEELGRNKERLDVEKQRLENDKNLAVIQAKNEAMEQEQQLRDRIANCKNRLMICSRSGKR